MANPIGFTLRMAATDGSTATAEPSTGSAETDTRFPPWLEALQADTPAEEIHQRPVWVRGSPVMNADGTPKTLAYITARFVQDRLDSAVGPLNWQVMFESLPTGAVRAGIGIRIPGDGTKEHDEWLWKWDVGVPSSIEAEKGAHSDSFKRAGVMWGIARDLYDERDDRSLPPADAAEAAAQAQAAQQQPQQAQAVRPRGAPIQQQVQQPVPYDENGPVGPDPEPEWVCPVHDDVKIVPGGVSRRTGRPYDAFYACPVAGCDQKGHSVGKPRR